MYILANNSRMILGLFTSKNWLNNAIKVIRDNNPGTILYYQKVTVNTFNTVLPNFFTIHPEKLIEINRDVDHV